MITTSHDTVAGLLGDPSVLLHAPARLREVVVRHLFVWESPQLALSVLEKLPGLTQISLNDLRIELLSSLGRGQEAIALARERVNLRPSATASCMLARTLFQAGDRKEAFELLNDLVKSHGDLVTVWSTLGDLRLAAGNALKAEACYNEILRTKPGSSTALRGLARCAMQAGDLEKARALLENATGGSDIRSRGMLLEAIALYERLDDSARLAELQKELEGLRRTTRENLAEQLEALAERTSGQQSPGVTYVRHEAHREEPFSDPWAELANSGLLAGIAMPSSLSEITGPPSSQQLLEQVFGLDIFRPGQLAVVKNILDGLDTLAIMPTGSGKSLCYQLPSLLLPRLTMVISPLIALMKDQLDSLPPFVQEKATVINSTLERGELDRRMAKIAAGVYRLVYAAPERLRQRHFLHAIRQAGISLLVIDEAHCVSMWGHDFRPDYLFIASAIIELGNPTLLAMTATATPEMAKEIVQQFSRPLQLVRTSMHRPNLILGVQACRNEEEKMLALVEVCKKESGAGIIYVNSREKAENLALLLRRKARIAAQFYHAGMGKADREAAQDSFMAGETRVVVATVAFGMGIDKENVRFIVHYDLPKSLEGYSQEIGRAGRDGRTAHCILLYTPTAKGLLTRHANGDRLGLEELRSVYRSVRDQADDNHAIVASNDLQRALADSGEERNLESRVRVAVSLLERAGLVKRHFDLPRTSIVTFHAGSAANDKDFDSLIRVVGTGSGRSNELSTLELAKNSGIQVDIIEGRILQWQEHGLLAYRGIGRDMHVEILDAPVDSGQRLQDLLERHAWVQEEQIAGILAYATMSGCRHAALLEHFGEKLDSTCTSCDRCLQGTTEPIVRQMPDPLRMEEDSRLARQLVVACLENLPNAVGVTGLIKTLRGSIDGPLGAERTPQFGTLSRVSKGKLKRLIDVMVEERILEAYERDGWPLLRVVFPSADA